MVLTTKGFREETAATYNEKLYKHIDMIAIPEVHSMVIDCLNKNSNENKIDEANKVCDLLMFMLEEKKLISEGAHQTFVDALIAATLLHNITYEYNDEWLEIFKTRDIITEIANEHNIPESFTDMVIATIESQLGERMPIKGCRPNPNTPGELFAWAVAITKKYIN